MAVLDAIVFDTTYWTEERTQSTRINRRWYNSADDVLVLSYFDSPPNIPSLQEVDQIRQFYRLQLAEVNGGLIEGEIVMLDGVPAVKVIAKRAQSPAGIGYLGSFTIPRRDFSYVIKVQSLEHGSTGIRETVIMDRELALGHIRCDDDGNIQGWASDPYDATFSEGILRNCADDEQYDVLFPEHPLSRLRRILHRLEETITVSERIKRSAPFQ